MLSCSLKEAQMVPNGACQGASSIVLVTCGSAVTSITVSLFALESSIQCVVEPPCSVERDLCPDGCALTQMASPTSAKQV